MCWRTARWLGGFVLITMLFFSSLAFTVLENAMSIIFVHRVKESRRSLLVSLVLPYIYILLLGVGFLVMTGIAGLLQSMGDNQIVVLGRGWSLDRFSFVLLYLVGVAGLIAVLASIYLVLPPGGRVTPRHALVGAAVVGVLWEITRHFLLWYFSALSLVGVVYGSLATTIVGLLSLEIARDAGPQGAQEAFRKLVPAALEKNFVKSIVGAHVGAHIAALPRFFQLPKRTLQRLEIACGRPFSEEPRHFRLKRRPDLIHLACLVRRDRGHEQASLAPTLHQSLGLELAQGLAHRGAADACLLAQLPFDQMLIGLEMER